MLCTIFTWPLHGEVGLRVSFIAAVGEDIGNVLITVRTSSSLADCPLAPKDLRATFSTRFVSSDAPLIKLYVTQSPCQFSAPTRCTTACPPVCSTRDSFRGTCRPASQRRKQISLPQLGPQQMGKATFLGAYRAYMWGSTHIEELHRVGRWLFLLAALATHAPGGCWTLALCRAGYRRSMSWGVLSNHWMFSTPNAHAAGLPKRP